MVEWLCAGGAWGDSEPLILLLILLDCVVMASHSPLDDPKSPHSRRYAYFQLFILSLYTLELLAKVISSGLWEARHAYLRNAWCQLDAVVVISGWLAMCADRVEDRFAVIRILRVLRPLRALRRLPGMPPLVASLMHALPKMGNVLMLCGFLILFLGIVGMELFKGALHYRCALPGFVPTPGHPGSREATAALGHTSFEAAAAAGHASLSHISHAAAVVRQLRGTGGAPTGMAIRGEYDTGQAVYDTGIACRPWAGQEACASASDGEARTCAYFDLNPTFDLTSFDSVSAASIAILQAMTFDTWTVPMYALIDSFSRWSALYFFVAITLGGFLVTNLFLAVRPWHFYSYIRGRVLRRRMFAPHATPTIACVRAPSRIGKLALVHLHALIHLHALAGDL